MPKIVVAHFNANFKIVVFFANFPFLKNSKFSKIRTKNQKVGKNSAAN